MTAQVIAMLPMGADADETIRRTVKALMKGKGLSVEALAPQVGMSVATLYRRLGSHGSKEAFKAGEVATLAPLLGVKVAQLYSGLDGTFAQASGETSGDPGNAAGDVVRHEGLEPPTRWFGAKRADLPELAVA